MKYVVVLQCLYCALKASGCSQETYLKSIGYMHKKKGEP
jgi:hypothetical protein